MPTYMLGLLPAREDHRTLRLADYLDLAALPMPPSSQKWSDKAGKFGLMLNDRIGDCAIADPGHAVQVWTGAAKGAPAVIPDSEILRAYSAVSGYVPNQQSTDRGCVMLDVMKYWQKTGIGGWKIDLYASVKPTDVQSLVYAVWLFGGVSAGVALPLAAQQQINSGQPWTAPANTRGVNAPGSWGGHAIRIVDFDGSGVTCITWGKLQRIDYKWLAVYCQEMFVQLDWDAWLDPKGVSAMGLDWHALADDFEQLTGQRPPDGPNVAPPIPQPPPLPGTEPELQIVLKGSLAGLKALSVNGKTITL